MAGGGNSEIEEVSATPETTKEKKGSQEVSFVRENDRAEIMKSPFVKDLTADQVDYRLFPCA